MSDPEVPPDERRRDERPQEERPREERPREDRPPEERERTERERRRAEQRGAIEESVELIAASMLRVGLLFLGAVIVLFAVGQLVGVDLLAMLSDVFDTREARWLTVAFFGLVLITMALRGFRRRSSV